MTTLSEACSTVLRESLLRQPLSWHLWLESLLSTTAADACCLLGLEGGELVPLAVLGLSTDTLGRRFQVESHPRLRAVLLADDAVRFPADSPLPDPFDGLIPDRQDRLHVHDCVGVALRDARGVVGALTIDALRPGTFDAAAIAALRATAQLAGACLAVVREQSRLAASIERQHQVSHALLEELRPNHRLIGRSPVMRMLQKEIETVAGSELTVLILGETGSGKELVARAIHYGSPRANEPLIYVNCAALPESLAESELFGHLAGAFSGASSHRRGKFEIADGGTLFLDEIGELPRGIQAKLLRALQGGEIQRVGSDEHIRVDVRIVAATNRDLAAEVRAGRFRADLFHRISIYPLHVPPLRERGRDVLLLAGASLERNRATLRLRSLRLAIEAQQALLAHTWPGNVRELEHLVSRASLKAAAEGAGADRVVTIHPRHLDLGAQLADDSTLARDAEVIEVPADIPLGAATERFQRALITRTLAANAGNWAAAARALGVDRGNLHRLARRLGLKADRGE